MTRAVSKPTIKRRDMDAVLSCLVDDAIGAGEWSDNLTKQAAEYLGLAGGIAVREYGRAIELAVDALQISEEGSVLLSPLAPALYRKVLERRGIRHELIDVDPASGTLPANVLQFAESKGVRAIVLDSPLGIAPNIEEFTELPLPIIEDISYSLGAKSGDTQCGGCGRFVVVRLEEDGVVTAGGGALVLGRHRRAVSELNSATEDLAECSMMGNMNASLASVQLKHIDEFAERRRAIATVYTKALTGSRHRAPTAGEIDANSHVVFPVMLNGSLKDAARYARSKRVNTKAAFADSIFTRYEIDGGQFPHAAAFAMRTLLFPLYPMLKRDEVEVISKVLATLP